MYYEVVGCNAILVIIGLGGGEKYCVGVAMLGVQYVLVTAAISDEEEYIVICVNIVYGLVPNLNLV